MAKNEIDFCDLWHPTDRQKEAGEAVEKYKYIMYGGAMGGGKSYWLRWQLIYLLMYFAKKYGLRGVRVGLFCENYPALKDRQISKVEAEFPEWLGRLNKADHDFILASNFGSGVLCFRNLDDTSKYKSAEFATIAIDELTQNPKDVFDLLRTRLRWPGISDVKFIAGTNPGGIGHNWVKDLWLNKVYEPTEKEQKQFHFVPAKAEDNPHLEQAYFTALEGLPEKMRKAYIEGNWDIFEGQFFDSWDRQIHVIPVPTGLHNEFIAMDYGYAGPASVGWYKVGVDEQLTRYKELYAEKLPYDSLAIEILKRTATNPEYAVGSPDMWGDKAHHKKDSLVGESGAETMNNIFSPHKTAPEHEEIWKLRRENGIPDSLNFQLMKADNNRSTGWGRCRIYLKSYQDQHGETRARFGVTDNCPNFIRTVPAMVHSQTKPEDMDGKGEDHCSEEFRYAVMSRPEKPKLAEKPHVLSSDEIVWRAAKKQVRRKMAHKDAEHELVGMRG